jgi:hypothetical protein
MEKLSSELERFATLVSGEKKSSSVIVMPSGKNTELLAQHLENLSHQKKMDFDILVLGEMPKSVPKSLSVLHYAERVPLGSSGSFGIGQMLGYALGYDFVINADLDCLPKSDDFMEKLIAAAKAEGKAILPLSDEEGKKGVYCINRYGIVPRAVMEKVGFEYLMFFKGAEDIDYQLRLDSAGLLSTSKTLETTHPYLSMVVFEVATRGTKYLYYYRAGLAILNLTLYHSIINARLKDSLICLGRLLYNYCYSFAYATVASRVLLQATLDAFLMRLEKKYDGLGFSIPELKAQAYSECVALDVGAGNAAGTVYFIEWEDDIGALAKAVRRVSHIWKFISLVGRRGECFKPSGRFLELYGFFIPYLMFLKPVLYKGSAFSWGRHPAYLLLGLLLLAIALPLFPFMVLFAQLRILIAGDYPPKTANAARMLKNFGKVVLEG